MMLKIITNILILFIYFIDLCCVYKLLNLDHNICIFVKILIFMIYMSSISYVALIAFLFTLNY